MYFVWHEHRAHRHQPTTQGLGEHNHVWLDSEVMRRQKRSGAKHSRLHFVGRQKRSVAAAQSLHVSQIVWPGNANTTLGLNRFNKERGVASSRQFFLKRDKITERHECRLGKKRTEALAPVVAVHQRQGAAGQAMEGAVAGDQSNAAGVRSRELDRGFHTFTTRT